MKLFIGFAITIFSINICFGQVKETEKKYSSVQLKSDLAFLKHLITDVHVNPNWELSSEQYQELFKQIEVKLRDSSSATDFLKLIKPVIAQLSDEHSQIYLKPKLQSLAFQYQAIYPPFTLSKVGNRYFIEDVLQTGSLTKGDQIITLNNMPIETWVSRCALDTIGFPNQREDIALRQFGYFYPLASENEATSFSIKLASGGSKIVKGTTLKTWQLFLDTHSQGKGTDCAERISYKRFGTTGYIQACWFDVKSKGKYSLDSIKLRINDIFRQIHVDSVKKLVIDVSQNGGGNSAVGRYLINFFYDKPYKDYQVDFKKSEEYQKLFQSWGFSTPEWASIPNGQLIHYGAGIVTPSDVPYRFDGKVIIVMSKPTFSSAMTFVTLVKDNNIAPVVGQPSLNGHPTGLGEQFYTTLPITGIFVRLSVKEFIRPAGKVKENVLMPDRILSDSQLSDPKELVKIVTQ